MEERNSERENPIWRRERDVERERERGKVHACGCVSV